MAEFGGDSAWFPPCHPSLTLFRSPALTVAIARLHPSLLRWLVRESPRYFRQNVLWLEVFQLTCRAWLITPPRIVLQRKEPAEAGSRTTDKQDG